MPSSLAHSSLEVHCSYRLKFFVAKNHLRSSSLSNCSLLDSRLLDHVQHALLKGLSTQGCGTTHAHMHYCPETKSKVRPKKNTPVANLCHPRARDETCVTLAMTLPSQSSSFWSLTVSVFVCCGERRPENKASATWGHGDRRQVWLLKDGDIMAQILGKKSIAVLVNDTCITSSSTIDR